MRIIAGEHKGRTLKAPKWDGLRPTSDKLRGTLFNIIQNRIEGARVLALLGDSVTTDHISPAGSIAPWSPAGEWLQAHGVGPLEFNSYGARRGHHEVMVRGTFANVRLKNLMVPGVEGGVTVHQPSGRPATEMS